MAKVYFADEREDFLSEILAAERPRKIFLVKRGSAENLAITAEIKAAMKKRGTEWAEFSAFSPNPQYADAKKAAVAFLEAGADFIIAVGGGSALDVAKCVKLFAAQGNTKDFLSPEIEFSPSNIPLLAVPTTAGTGSEATHFAVVYDGEKKFSLAHPSLCPEYAVLDARALATLPLYQKKCALLDALCQAIEAWWSKNATKESREYSRQAIGLVIDTGEAYPTNFSLDLGKDMLRAAHLSGKAINIAKTTAPHAMSYILTKRYGLPHGHAVAICLPAVWQYMVANGDEKFSRSAEEIAFALGKRDADSAIKFFQNLLLRWEISPPVIKEENIKELAESVNAERLKNSPYSFTQKELAELYRRIGK